MITDQQAFEIARAFLMSENARSTMLADIIEVGNLTYSIRDLDSGLRVWCQEQGKNGLRWVYELEIWNFLDVTDENLPDDDPSFKPKISRFIGNEATLKRDLILLKLAI